MDNREVADAYAMRAVDLFVEQTQHRSIPASVSGLSGLATAHAVLALIDLIAGDRETEIEQLQYQLEARRAQLADRDKRVQELLDQLDGCREALRQRENAEANAAKTNNDLRKSYE